MNTVKIIKNSLVALVSLSTPLNAMNEMQTLPEQTIQHENAQTLCRETAWLVHVSRVFPQGGTVIAGSLGIAPGKDFPMEFQEQDALRKQASAFLSCLRNTVHWSVNSMIYPHEGSGSSTAGEHIKFNVSREDARYAILEPMSVFKDRHLVGCWNDVFHVGSHTLSDQSVIFVPKDDTTFNCSVGTYAGTIQRYDGSLRSAVDDFLRSKNISIIYPAYKGIKSDRIVMVDTTTPPPCFFEEKVLTSEALAGLLTLDNKGHKQTVIEDIEKSMATVLAPIRGFMINEHFKTCFDHVELDGTSVCVQCKKGPQQLAKERLLVCSGCKLAHYCSRDCQKVHWKNSHKGRCALIGSIDHSSFHSQYLEYYGNTSPAYHFLVIPLLKKRFEKLKSTYPLPRDLQQIEQYERVMYFLVNHFYSPDAEYLAKRVSFATHTLEGFRNYCKYVISEVEKYKNIHIQREQSTHQ